MCYIVLRDHNQVLHFETALIFSDPFWSSFASPAEDAKKKIGPPNGSRQFLAVEGHHSLAHPLPCCYRRCLQEEPLAENSALTLQHIETLQLNYAMMRHDFSIILSIRLNQHRSQQYQEVSRFANQSTCTGCKEGLLWYFKYTTVYYEY